jgi:hypothetical protein
VIVTSEGKAKFEADLARFLKFEGISRDVLEARILELSKRLRDVQSAHDDVLARCNELRDENHQLRLVGTHEANFLRSVLPEVERGRKKHGKAHKFAALAEEVGEVAKALYDGKTDRSLREELVQVCAVAVQIAVDGESDFGRPPCEPVGDNS